MVFHCKNGVNAESAVEIPIQVDSAVCILNMLGLYWLTIASGNSQKIFEEKK